MSDVDEIDEDINFSSGDEDGGEGDYAYDVDESDIVQPQPMLRKKEAPATTSVARVPAPLPRSQAQVPVTHEGDDDEYNDEGFDDYSNDFEDVDGPFGTGLSRISNTSQKGGRRGSATATAAGIPPPSANLVAAQIQLPSVAMVPLQAEIALEQISKEVVRLRNQQRNLLQDRRQAAREKKQRAESRRAQHLMELRELQARLAQSVDDSARHQEKAASLQRSLDAALSSKDILMADLEAKDKDVAEMKTRSQRLQLEADQRASDMEALRRDHERKVEEWENERAALKAEITRSGMLAAVVQQSLEVNEARLAKERERLPEQHRRLLDEQAARNKALEGALLEREGIMRAEEARRTALLDQRAKDASEEVARQRLRLENDLADERASLRDKAQQLEQERQRLEAQVNKEKSLLAASAMDLSRREAAVAEEHRAIDRARGELEAAKVAIEPILRATNADRDAARRALENAHGVLREAEERAAAVMEAEKGLLRLEMEVQARETAAEDLRVRYTTARKLLQAEAAKLIVTQKAADAERFRLHSAALELASQATEIRRIAGVAGKQARHAAATKSSSIAAEKENPGVFGDDFPPKLLGTMDQLDHLQSAMQKLANSLSQPPKAPSQPLHHQHQQSSIGAISPTPSHGTGGRGGRRDEGAMQWLMDAPSAFKPQPFSDRAPPPPPKHHDDFDDDQFLQSAAQLRRPPTMPPSSSSSSSSYDLPAGAFGSTARPVGGPLAAARSSWPFPSAPDVLATAGAPSRVDEDDALHGVNLRVSVDSATESVKSMKEAAARFGVYA